MTERNVEDVIEKIGRHLDHLPIQELSDRDQVFLYSVVEMVRKDEHARMFLSAVWEFYITAWLVDKNEITTLLYFAKMRMQSMNEKFGDEL